MHEYSVHVNSTQKNTGDTDVKSPRSHLHDNDDDNGETPLYLNTVDLLCYKMNIVDVAVNSNKHNIYMYTNPLEIYLNV